MTNIMQVQLGKRGLTLEFIEDLKKRFEKVENIRVSLLKNSTRDKEEVKEIAEKIIKGLGNKYTCKIIGYTLILKKWRKPRLLK